MKQKDLYKKLTTYGVHSTAVGVTYTWKEYADLCAHARRLEEDRKAVEKKNPP
jgi:hypothetical protein